MILHSTRSVNQATPAEAIVTGLSDDGGLYAPCALPVFSGFILRFSRRDVKQKII